MHFTCLIGTGAEHLKCEIVLDISSIEDKILWDKEEGRFVAP